MVEKNGEALQPVINYRSSDSYDVDDEGRLTVLGSRQLIYGAHGRVEKALKRGKETARYYYDEKNNPVLKKSADGSMHVYFKDMLVKDKTLYAPFSLPVVDKTVGYFKNHQFRAIDTDHVGSLIGLYPL